MGRREGSWGMREKERERIKEPGLGHVVLVWGAACGDGGSGFSLLQPASTI